jgi:hypothetical protein
MRRTVLCSFDTVVYTTLKQLQTACQLSSYYNLATYLDQAKLDEWQSEIDALLKIYSTQIAKTIMLLDLNEKKKLILLAHLSQEQAVEVLEMNLRASDIMSSNQIHNRTNSEMAHHTQEMMAHHNRSVQSATNSIYHAI